MLCPLKRNNNIRKRDCMSISINESYHNRTLRKDNKLGMVSFFALFKLLTTIIVLSHCHGVNSFSVQVPLSSLSSLVSCRRPNKYRDNNIKKNNNKATSPSYQNTYYCGKIMAIPGYMVTDAKEVPEDKNNEDQEDDEPSGPELPVLKVLALHDSESTGIDFAQTLEPIQEVMKEEHELDLQITAPWAPWSKPKEYGSSWWTVPYGQQSYSAFEYIGFEASCNMVISEIEMENPDLILAHSQGAILISAMLALGRISKHPRLGYVLNGVAWPKPFERELRSLKLTKKGGKECVGPQMFIIIGSKDETSPPDSAKRVKTSFEKAGFRVSSCTHPGGNAIPIDNEVVRQELVEWILDSS